MSDDNLLRTPKYKLALNAARALVTLTYICTDEPEALLTSYDGINRWDVFATTAPDRVIPILPEHLPTEDDSPEVRARKIKKLDDRKRSRRQFGGTPEECVDHVLKEDPHSTQGLGAIQITNANLIEGLNEKLHAFSEKRYRDVRWNSMLVFVGTLPAKQVIPESMWDIFYPIDIREEGRQALQSRAVDTRVRHGLPGSQEILTEFKEACGWLPEIPYVEGSNTLLEGLTLAEARSAMLLSIIATRKEGKSLIHPHTIDAYKNRWARVP